MPRQYFLLLGIYMLSFTLSHVAYANLSTSDFVQKASIANQFEIDSSKLALEKAQNSETKAFAERMVKDHMETGTKMNKILSTSDVNAASATTLDDKHQKLLDELQSVSGKAFDKRYLAIQTEAHEEAVNLFSAYARNGENADLRTFANETLPTLKDHYQQVEKM